MDSDVFKYSLTANTTELLLPAEAASLPLLDDEPVLLEDPVMTPLEMITFSFFPSQGVGKNLTSTSFM